MWIKNGENTLINLDNVTTIGIYENEEDGYEDGTAPKTSYGVTLTFADGRQTILLFEKGKHREFFDQLWNMFIEEDSRRNASID